ncbi:MAG TPA: hypothetical protein VEK79_06275 [Thermoanaerobaculia bacterium]|nr:hypothetical protein [Thermoanaerobaculia bacterium]
MLRFLSCMLCVFLASGIFAQVAVELDPVGAEGQGRTGPGEEPAAPRVVEEQSTKARAITALNDTGPNGDLYTTSPPAPATTGVLLQANSGTPDVYMKLGTTTNTSDFAVFDSANTAHFRIFGDGRILLGKDAGYHAGYHVQLKSSFDDIAALNAWSHTTVEANADQEDTGAYILGYQNVTAGVHNTGGTYGARIRGWLFGAGEVDDVYGAYVQAGLYPSPAVNGKVNRAYGVVLDLARNQGTLVKGYSLYIRDVLADEGYGIYQLGTNDVNYFGGRLGIGTVAPATKLHVFGSTEQFAQIETGASQSAGIRLKNPSRQFQLYLDGTDSKFHIRDTAATTDPNRITIDGAGNVGIGTTTPTATLDVDGAMKVNGNIVGPGLSKPSSITGFKVIGAVYQDVAEWVPATTDLAAGTVVVLNPERTNEVMASHGAYDTSVAGVVSEQPGIILGLEGDGKEQIATTGRVKVRVDARSHPIRVGDLLVTSEIPGAAMKSEPFEINGRRFHQPGTIIGKALEPLEGAIAEILVLLSMQ